ncbi:MAG: bactofilin family protein [Asticcacaulis sp.]
MFNKTNKPTARPEPLPPVAPPPLDMPPPQVNLNKRPSTPASMGGMMSGSLAQGSKNFSSVGSGIVIEGNISGNGDLLLDGTVHGDVKVSHLTVGEAGNIEGKIEADSIEIRGRVVGSIKGQQIKLQATAYVEGDITHEQLAIDVGAYFQGRCLQTRRVEAPVASVTPPVSAPAAPAPAPASSSAPPSVTVGAPSLGSYDMSALSDLK